MTDNATNKIYLLGSKPFGVESLIVMDKKKLMLQGFDSLEETKSIFNKAYKILLAPSFTPSIPPSKEEMEYHHEFMWLMDFYPVILEFDRSNVSDILKKWRKKKRSVFQTKDKYFRLDYWHCPMRSGFLKKFGVLDIVRDIENTPFINAEGKIVIRVNNITYHDENEPHEIPKELTDEEADEILRKRGYL